MKRQIPIVTCFVLGFLIANGCVSDETLTAKGFSEANFRAVVAGMTEEQVATLLGQPFYVYTHIDYGPGKGSNNAQGRLSPEQVKGKGSIAFYGLRYSQPKKKYADFRVFDVFINADGIVTDTQTYLTD